MTYEEWVIREWARRTLSGPAPYNQRPWPKKKVTILEIVNDPHEYDYGSTPPPGFDVTWIEEGRKRPVHVSLDVEDLEVFVREILDIVDIEEKP